MPVNERAVIAPRGARARRWLGGCLSVLSGCFAVSVCADSQAVRSPSFDGGFTASDTYVSGDRDNNSYSIDLHATLPLAEYFGTVLAGSYSRTNYRDSFRSAVGTLPDTRSPPSCEANTGALSLELFMRDGDLGRVGLGYGRRSPRFDCEATFLSTGDKSTDIDSVSANAEYYFSHLTIGIVGSRADLGGDNKLDSAGGFAHWYATDNWRITLGADSLDLGDTYRLTTEYQPELFGGSMSLTGGFALQRHTIDSQVFMVGFRYYFDEHVKLILRDRHYR